MCRLQAQQPVAQYTVAQYRVDWQRSPVASERGACDVNSQAQIQATERIAALGRLQSCAESLPVEIEIQRRQDNAMRNAYLWQHGIAA